MGDFDLDAAPLLSDLLQHVAAGRIQIPEFQREFMLTDSWVRSLLASVSLGYPIGAVTLLEAGSSEFRFRSRPLAGVTASPDALPVWFLVDGQQRLSALYQALVSNRGVLAAGDGKRQHFLDVQAVLDATVDRDEAVSSVNSGADALGDRKAGGEHTVSSPSLFPLRLALGSDSALRLWARSLATDRLWERFEREVVNRVRGYTLPTIVLGPETTRWTIRVHGGPDGPRLSNDFQVARLR